MTYELIQQFQKYVKNGKIDKFQEYIIKNNLTNEFRQQCFLSTYRRGYQPGTVDYKEAKDLSNFLLKLSEETFKQKFGPELADRFIRNIYKEEQPSIGIFNAFMLTNPDIKVNSEHEAAQMKELFDMASNKDAIIGTHIIGSDIGDRLAREGIVLTGHKWVANDFDNKSGSIKGRLEKNITFFDNDPIGLITQIIRSRGYNNPRSEFNDIMLVSIPRQELKVNESRIIEQRDFGVGPEDCLNPEYIKGFVRVAVKDGSIESFYSNPLFRDKTFGTHKDTTQSLSTDDWKNKFEGWYEQANMTKTVVLKSKVMNFLKGLSKGKNKELSEEEQIR